jgi:alkyldihydroxyacetonephosphate synthase
MESQPASPGSRAHGRALGRWAHPDEAPGLTPTVRSYLDANVGRATPWPMVEPCWSQIADIELPQNLLTVLSGIVGADHVSQKPSDRLRAGSGASYLDLIRLRSGDVSDVPAAVVAPRNHDETIAVIQACEMAGVAIVPTGGGTSVVGGLAARGLRIAILTYRMRDVINVDEQSHVVRVQAGITGPLLEPILAARGLTLGHLPQSWEQASIGGYVATRSAGQASSGYGRSDDMVEGVRLAAPIGEWRVGHTPASAAGPHLLELVIGSEGSLGVITEVDLRVRSLPRSRKYEAFMMPSFEAGLEMFRALAHAGISADVMRLSDAPETQTTMLMSAPDGVAGRALNGYLRGRGVDRQTRSLVILGWEGRDNQDVSRRRSAAKSFLRRWNAVSLPGKPGESWRRHRFSGPYLRDSLIDAGYLVETLETATRWSNVLELRSAIHEALTSSLTSSSTTPYVMTHVSHVYETGASLYTTVITVADRNDPLGQWRQAKIEATNAIMAKGGTVTHHHAIGRDHAPWLLSEVGEPGITLLRSVKAVFDPRGICNPGVLGL